jgi:hypothetical protein
VFILSAALLTFASDYKSRVTSHDLRVSIFLTKRLTILRSSLLYTIYYSVLLNVFQKLGNYMRTLRYTAKYI